MNKLFIAAAIAATAAPIATVIHRENAEWIIRCFLVHEIALLVIVLMMILRQPASRNFLAESELRLERLERESLEFRVKMAIDALNNHRNPVDGIAVAKILLRAPASPTDKQS